MPLNKQNFHLKLIFRDILRNYQILDFEMNASDDHCPSTWYQVYIIIILDYL